jgi:DNA-binding GntR family transcriptional regulator
MPGPDEHAAGHRYAEIAADLRARIESGELQEGARVPGENALMRSYAVARATARDALAMLKHEGLVTARQGSGTVVAPQSRIVRDTSARYARRSIDTSPFRSDAKSAKQDATWEHESQESTATADVASRLGIHAGSPVMHTSYRFLSNGRPIQVSESWEPLSITRDTPVEYPESSPTAGVVARMDVIQQFVTHVIERVTARAANSEEIQQLQLPTRGAYVLVIDRTHYTEDRAVETCDIIFPGDRYELTYTIPVDPV